MTENDMNRLKEIDSKLEDHVESESEYEPLN